jgi:hypothetical protein
MDAPASVGASVFRPPTGNRALPHGSLEQLKRAGDVPAPRGKQYYRRRPLSYQASLGNVGRSADRLRSEPASSWKRIATEASGVLGMDAGQAPDCRLWLGPSVRTRSPASLITHAKARTPKHP